MSSIASLLSTAGIKSLVKMRVPRPPCGDGAAPPVLCRLSEEMQVRCWEERHSFCLPAVGKEGMTAATSCVST